MENAADALKMAAAVLVFVLALSISINAFSEARQAADTVLAYKDRETDYIYGNYYYESNGKSRQVGVETVVQNIYRAYNENYKIIFYKNSGIDIKNFTSATDGNNEFPVLYTKQKKNEDTGKIETIYIKSIDLEKEVLPAGYIERFLNGILYNSYPDNLENYNKLFNIEKGDFWKTKSLYSYLQEKIITEYSGIYYQEEVGVGKSDAPNANKTKKRVIVYQLQ